MLGIHNGATTFLKSFMPYALPIHCVAHKEALAAKDVNDPIADATEKVMTGVYYYFCNSSKRCSLYQTLLIGLDSEDIPGLAKLHVIRWLSRGKTLDAFVRNLGPLQIYFLSTASKDVIADECTIAMNNDSLSTDEKLEKISMLRKSICTGVTIASSLFLHDIIFAKLNSLNLVFQKTNLTPVIVHEHYTATTASIIAEYCNDKSDQFYLRSDKPIGCFMRHCAKKLSEGKLEFTFGINDVTTSHSIFTGWGCELKVQITPIEFYNLCQFFCRYSLSIVEALHNRLQCNELQKFGALDISFYRRHHDDRNLLRKYLSEIAAFYGQPKKYKPIDLGSHPAWRQSGVEEAEILEAANLARSVLNCDKSQDTVEEVDINTSEDNISQKTNILSFQGFTSTSLKSHLERTLTNTPSGLTKLRIGYFSELTSKPLVTSANIEQEIEQFITHMCSHCFDRFDIPDAKGNKSMQFLDAYTFFEFHKLEMKTMFPNIFELMSIPLLLALSNSAVEGGFSTLNCIQSNRRSSLQVYTTNSLMRICLLCPSELLIKNDNVLCQRILSMWDKLPNYKKYGSEKHKTQTKLVATRGTGVLAAENKRKFTGSSSFQFPVKIEEAFEMQKKKICIVLKNEVWELSRDDEYHEVKSFARTLKSSEQFHTMIKSSRESINDSKSKKNNRQGCIKIGDASYTLTKDDAIWAIHKSSNEDVLVHVGKTGSIGNLASYSMNVYGRMFHTLQPKTWLVDEIINASVVLLRIYCNAKFGKGCYIIADIDFYHFYASKDLTDEEKITKVMNCFFGNADNFKKCKYMLIPIYLPNHFILVVIDFENLEVQLFDSLKINRPQVLDDIKSYASYLLSYFCNEDVNFTGIDMREKTSHQGNSYDCGCYTIWNMVRVIRGLEFVALPTDFRQTLALWLLSQDQTIFFPGFVPPPEEIIEIDDD